MRYPLLKEVYKGSNLLPIIKHISQEKINKFGVASGSTGAVHVDPEFCKTMPFKTTLAHGFLTLAYVSEMMEINFGTDWAYSGELEVKFIGTASPGDSLIINGKIIEVTTEGSNNLVTCEVIVENHLGNKVLVGNTKIVITTSSNLLIED